MIGKEVGTMANVYFDNAATTKLDEEVLSTMMPYLKDLMMIFYRFLPFYPSNQLTHNQMELT